MGNGALGFFDFLFVEKDTFWFIYVSLGVVVGLLFVYSQREYDPLEFWLGILVCISVWPILLLIALKLSWTAIYRSVSDKGFGKSLTDGIVAYKYKVANFKASKSAYKKRKQRQDDHRNGTP